MGWWSTDGKGKGRSTTRLGPRPAAAHAASEPRRSSPPPRPAPAAFSIAPPGAPTHSRQYVHAGVCRRYWETRTPLPWSDVHLPNNWHLSADRVPILPVPMSGRARRDEIQHRQRRLPDDLYYDPRYAVDSPLWDTWFRDEHDVRARVLFCRRTQQPMTGMCRAPDAPSEPSPGARTYACARPDADPVAVALSVATTTS
ncbi:ADP-ribosylation factor-related protein 1 [Hordeum vulgare]|nr:ADP-ribosylation factor-related protein 1 [Hordeum vulgare]